MDDTFKAVKVSEHVWWVGAIDWDIRDFHGYLTSRGSTYNAYLILADKVTLIDTVRDHFRDEMFARIASVVDPKSIRYIVSNHAEMDHTGSLPATLDAIQPEKVFASTLGVKTLADHFRLSREIIGVKDGETLSLGNLTLRFLETRMLHWPESMMTYLEEDVVLFSQDGFGMHLATSERWADEVDPCVRDYEAAKYYANILMIYSPVVAKLLARVKAMGLAPAVLAPDHGPMYRGEEIARILASYAKWAEHKPTTKAVVVYDTMWGSTAAMARAVCEGLTAGGSPNKLYHLRATHRSDVVTEVLDAGALIVGSPTLNNGMFPTVADFLCYLDGLRPTNLVAAGFGSYGWSGDAVKQVVEALKGMKLEVIGEGLKARYVPDARALEPCFALGQQIAVLLKGRVAS